MKTVMVPAGGRIPVTFTEVSLTTPAQIDLSVTISDASPVETVRTQSSGR